MTVFRALFILKEDRIILSKRFLTVDKKLHLLQQEKFIQIPCDEVMNEVL